MWRDSRPRRAQKESPREVAQDEWPGGPTNELRSDRLPERSFRVPRRDARRGSVRSWVLGSYRVPSLTCDDRTEVPRVGEFAQHPMPKISPALITSFDRRAPNPMGHLRAPAGTCDYNRPPWWYQGLLLRRRLNEVAHR